MTRYSAEQRGLDPCEPIGAQRVDLPLGQLERPRPLVDRVAVDPVARIVHAADGGGVQVALIAVQRHALEALHLFAPVAWYALAQQAARQLRRLIARRLKGVERERRQQRKAWIGCAGRGGALRQPP